VHGAASKPGFLSAGNIEELNLNIGKVTSLCDKIDDSLRTADDGPVKDVLQDISNAIRLVNKNHEVICKGHNENAGAGAALGNGPGPGSVTGSMVSLGTIPKKNRTETPVSLDPDKNRDIFPDEVMEIRAAAPRLFVRPKITNPEHIKFCEAVTKAESSTLIFNLDLGRVPIMNVDTMSNRATLALAAMAAKADNMVGAVPSEDTVATIDDILSMSKDIEFFGRKTKTYTNSKDEKSGSFCTIPVKYEFSDRDTRIEAEKFLRTKCGAHCTTPYPTVLRECIRQTAEQVKKKFPGNQVKIMVDAEKFCLKVAKREQPADNGSGDGSGAGASAGAGAGTGARTGKPVKWDYLTEHVRLPAEAFNIAARKVPEGFKIDPIDFSYMEKTVGEDGEAMEADLQVNDNP
jgi:hypothetical protein